MRQIKFRVWDIIAKKMLPWEDVFHLPAWDIFPGTPEQRAYEVMQWTGMKDKNGLEIYEGDIAKTSDSPRTMAVQYQAPSFIMRAKNKSGGWSKEWSEFILSPDQNQFQEVIGNIYEHPNLLKGNQ